MARGSVKQIAKGRWKARISDSTKGRPRRQPSKMFRTKGEGDAWVLERLDALGKGTYAPPSSATVAELFEADLDVEVKRGGLRESTDEQYRRTFDRHARPAFGSIRAQDLRAAHLDRLYAGMLAKGLAPSTVRQVHNLLSGVFSRAVKRGDLASNPCKRASPPATQTAETPTWSLDEQQKFFASDVVRDDPDFALWWLLAATGLRRGEALALSRDDDVDLDAGTVTVRRNAVLVGGQVTIGAPKTRRSRRLVKIGPTTVQVLRGHLAAQRAQRIATGASDHGFVFAGVDGRPPNPATVSRRFARLAAKPGLRPVSLHSLRHGHGSLLLDRGERIHDVAARLGHDPAVLLRVYAHHTAASQDSAAACEVLLDGARPDLRVVPDETTPAEGEAEPLAELL